MTVYVKKYDSVVLAALHTLLIFGLLQNSKAYWRDELDEGQTYDEVTVTMKLKIMMTGLIIREFNVHKVNKVC